MEKKGLSMIGIESKKVDNNKIGVVDVTGLSGVDEVKHCGMLV